MSTCDSASVLCQGSDTSTRNIATRAEISSSCLRVSGKSGWALGSTDLVCVGGLLFLKDDVLDAEPGRSRGFEGKATFRSIGMTKKGPFFWSSQRKKKQARKNGPPQFKIPVAAVGAVCLCDADACLYWNRAAEEGAWVGLKPDLQGGTGFNLLRVQFWTPVQRKCV